MIDHIHEIWLLKMDLVETYIIISPRPERLLDQIPYYTDAEELTSNWRK